ncbi:hypothetical protein CPB83DRAFT_624387 [Crepidotus variabilis]|uniref:Uncharacterized protein n=1 Tax=Crepidotus variabilis TaxID=179855 RepID=A0A9P6JU52_9AGAR|nr:hypothetical protein CPB83DRAFT_624387 [Crepidotus variabilis]
MITKCHRTFDTPCTGFVNLSAWCAMYITGMGGRSVVLITYSCQIHLCEGCFQGVV